MPHLRARPYHCPVNTAFRFSTQAFVPSTYRSIDILLISRMVHVRHWQAMILRAAAELAFANDVGPEPFQRRSGAPGLRQIPNSPDRARRIPAPHAALCWGSLVAAIRDVESAKMYFAHFAQPRRAYSFGQLRNPARYATMPLAGRPRAA